MFDYSGGELQHKAGRTQFATEGCSKSLNFQLCNQKPVGIYPVGSNKPNHLAVHLFIIYLSKLLPLFAERLRMLSSLNISRAQMITGLRWQALSFSLVHFLSLSFSLVWEQCQLGSAKWKFAYWIITRHARVSVSTVDSISRSGPGSLLQQIFWLPSLSAVSVSEAQSFRLKLSAALFDALAIDHRRTGSEMSVLNTH